MSLDCTKCGYNIDECVCEINSMKIVTYTLPERLLEEIEKEEEITGKDENEVIAAALEEYFSPLRVRDRELLRSEPYQTMVTRLMHQVDSNRRAKHGRDTSGEYQTFGSVEREDDV